MKTYKALTIAGSDSGGGAGIQADLKTFQELNVYGMSALTAVTAQNTLGVHGVYPLSIEAVEEQIEAIGTDLGTDAVKTGMLFNSEIIQAVSEKIQKYKWENVVVDPVMIAKGGASLLQSEAVLALKKNLIPLAMVITPNIPEAEVLTNKKITNLDDKKEVAKMIYDIGAKNVVIKGGHDYSSDKLVDILYDGQDFFYLSSKRVDTKNTHGTGCTFSACITAELAKGNNVRTAFQIAKEFIHSAIEEDLKLGKGHGPTNHWAYKIRKNTLV